ncbi:MAG: GAK system XXXCH domain-containing protein [Desulfarculaceae bacterium]|nr:GAK system XXXCH domain-containing protein [Desulfarculaceae bacterium]MCF8071533.1 GAK system XXXCH domain-containing protein [Desulfarculaceae bacterium]MCF8102348.1 GAK system XXXCH domain-containing protein [Desulfarculaceae bacterium]MCF8114812.1 GAK system XXXCH domain-containing protein [Desulfarculaceae bacterium]
MSNDPNKKKAKHAFSREEAVEYLRRLADQLEDGSIQVSNEEMEFEGLIKVKEELKTKKGKTSVKVQFKVSTQEVPHEEEPGADAQPELAIDQAAPEQTEDNAEADEQPSSYKKLKKLMGKRFKEIGKALEEGGQVSQADLAAFCDNCLQMVTFTGSKLGEDLYPQFEAAAQALRAAGESGDPAAIKEAYDLLDGQKKACHKEYK